MKVVLLMALCIAWLGAFSWFSGYRISMGCVGTLCADAGFAWSAIGSILMLVASTLLAGVLLAKLWVKGVFFTGSGIGNHTICCCVLPRA